MQSHTSQNTPRAAAGAGGGFWFVSGAGAALAILTALPFVPTAAAPQFHAPAPRPSSISLPVSSPAEVTVRIWSLWSPTTLRAVPVNSAARVRLCESCRWDRASGPVNIHATGNRAQLEDAASLDFTTGSAEFSGVWRFELPDGNSAESASRAMLSASDGHLQVTLRLSMEEYVAGVLAAEARGVASPESLKAMAVAIRTYAVRFRGRHRSQSYDFCDSTHCQVLHLSGAATRYLAAASATAGEILTYNGKPATTYYHRDCGGTTEAAGIAWHDVDAPYLTQQTDPYCTRAGHSEWGAEITRDDLRRALVSAGIALPPNWHGVEVVARTPSGRARKLRLVGNSNLLIAAQALRLAVAHTLGGNKVRSDLFEVHAEGGNYIFSGVGSGHGVGMCQNGAAEMGAEGKRYNDILAFYYPGTELYSTPPSEAAVAGN